MSDETVYRITPKGIMTVFFVKELGLTWEDALEKSEALANDIFLKGYIYAHETEIEVL